MYRIRAVVTLLIIGMFLSFTNASFGLSSARFTSESPFKLPLPPGVYVEVTQSNNMPPPQWDHNGLSAYAFDFALLTGTYHFVVTAAQGGKVIAVDDSSTIQCDGLDHEYAPNNTLFSGCWTHANYVLIADDDGKTAALYLHLLAHSAKVRVGYHVQQGQQLGLADTTGYALGNPHLHFQVEDIPRIPSNPQQSPGWWFTQSVPVSFSDPELIKIRSDGVPLTYDKICLGDKTCSTTPPPTILPGGVWVNPSTRQPVYDVIHFAARAYPSHSGDPAIAQVNFTVGSKGAWRIACTAVPPVTGDVFACDANLKDLGISYGQIQVSFDVYDQAGNVNLAPNGVHTLTYIPTPPLELEVNPSAFNVNDGNICVGVRCSITLSSPSSNTSNITWKATVSFTQKTGYTGESVSPSSGTLAPGQTISVFLTFAFDSCGLVTGSIAFTGGASPVVTQFSGSLGPC